MADNHDLDWVRHLLHDWANWLGHNGGYAHQTSVEWWRQGGGGGVFGSRIPLDVEPSPTVARSSRAMQHLRMLDGPAAELLAQLYLRKAQTSLAMLAKKNGIGLTLYQTRRRDAERKFLGLFQALDASP